MPIKSLLLIAALWTASSCQADEVRLSCLFDQAYAAGEMDSEAKKLQTAFNTTSAGRVVVLDLKPPRYLSGGNIRLFPDGPKAILVDDDVITIIWKAEQHARLPTMNLSVNRFSLEAFETSTLKRLGLGQDQFVWSRSGKCKVDGRKF